MPLHAVIPLLQEVTERSVHVKVLNAASLRRDLVFGETGLQYASRLGIHGGR